MLVSQKTLAVIFGVSSCPRAPELQALPQCANSATDFYDYLHRTLGLPEGNVLNLFDSPSAASEQLENIEDWLQQKVTKETSDLIVFYTGHGGFSRSDRSYYLAVHRTKTGSEGHTSLRYHDLAASLKRHSGPVRKYIILDCCFAAAAIVGMQSDVQQMVSKNIELELPSSGTAVLCSSASKLVSIAPVGHRHTMFSGALLKCLREGLSSGSQALTLEEICSGARNIIEEMFPVDAVRPELHVPEQHRGNPALVPLFPNALFRGEALGPQRDPHTKTEEVTRLARSLFASHENVAVGAIAGIASSLCFHWGPFPIGLVSAPGYGPPVFAPVGPAVCLAVAVLFLMRRRNQLDLQAGMIGLLILYPAWWAAYQILIKLTLASEALKGYAALQTFFLCLSAAAAGFCGSFLVYVALDFSYRSRRRFTISRPAKNAGILAIVAGCWQLSSPFNTSAQLPTLGLFVPWQMLFAEMLFPVTRFRKPASTFVMLRPYFMAALVSVVAGLYTLRNPPPPYIGMSIGEAEKSRSGAQTTLSVTFSIFKRGIANVSCRIEFLLPSGLYQAYDLAPLSKDLTEDLKSTLTVNATSVDEAKARLVCNADGATHITDWEMISIKN